MKTAVTLSGHRRRGALPRVTSSPRPSSPRQEPEREPGRESLPVPAAGSREQAPERPL